MSKFALRALAQALDFELRPSGVSVTLVTPGFVETEIHRIDKHGVYHADARHPAPAAIRMSAERAAAQIVTAVARRRREVVITAFGKVVVAIARHLPALTTWAIRTFGIRSRRDPAEATDPTP
jgi:short-subunit dehydrogenase